MGAVTGPKDVVAVVDASGSMKNAGRKLAAVVPPAPAQDEAKTEGTSSQDRERPYLGQDQCLGQAAAVVNAPF